MILVDRRVQKVLHQYALKVGEDKAWLESVFRQGKHALIQHARHHRDHFHVRFFNPVAQELGRRVAPLLTQRPEQNIMTHRVHSGDTLGAIARRYGITVAQLQKANHMKGSFLRLSQVLQVPIHGPCTRCPIPAPIALPPRLLPPALAAQESAAPKAGPVPAPVPVPGAVSPLSVLPLAGTAAARVEP
jgi:LysM repeat protein